MAQPDPRFGRPDVLFFGIGAQKSGTSWLKDYLRSHPQVHIAKREIHYWNRREMPDGPAVRRLRRQARTIEDINPQRREFLAHSERMLTEDDPSHSLYADLIFKKAGKKPVVGEITPAYAVLSRDSFAAMNGLAGNVRFLFLMRDPVARLHSSLRMRLGNAGRRRNPGTVAGTVLDELARVIAKGKEDDFVGRSRYERTLGELEAAVPAAQIGCFFYEDLFGQQDVAPICAFLGIDPVPGPFDKVVNTGTVRTSMDEDFEARALQLLRGTYEDAERRFGDRLPAIWRQRLDRARAGDAVSVGGAG